LLERGLSYSQIGILYAVREILINLMEVPSGVIADALGRRKSMLVSFLAYGIAFIGFYLSPSFWFFFVPMVFFALGDAFRTGTHKAMIFAYLELNNWTHLRAHYYGGTRAWSQAGSAISALIAGGLVYWQGSYAPIFLFTLIPYGLDFLLILSYPARLDGPRTSNPHVLGSLWKSLKRPPLIQGILNQSLFSGYYKGIKDYLQPLIAAVIIGEAAELTPLLTAGVYSVLYFITAYASSRSGSFSDLFASPRTPLALTLFGGLAFGLGAGLAQHWDLSALGVVLFAGILIGENLRKPLGLGYISSFMDDESMASALSVESQAETGFGALFALGLGFAIDYLGLGMGISVVTGVALVLGVVFSIPVEDKGELRGSE